MSCLSEPLTKNMLWFGLDHSLVNSCCVNPLKLYVALANTVQSDIFSVTSATSHLFDLTAGLLRRVWVLACLTCKYSGFQISSSRFYYSTESCCFLEAELAKVVVDRV